MATLLVAGVATSVLVRAPAQRGRALSDGTLRAESDPPGAAIVIDGRGRGRTPATLSLVPGVHRVTLRHDQYADATYQIHVDADRTTTLVAELWLRNPQLQRLRPPFPGATITNAGFLRDGQVALTVAVPPGDERQLWLVDRRGGTRRLWPSAARGGVAVAPDGQQLAYLARGQDTAVGVGHLDEVWIARADGGRGERRYALPAPAGDERLLDLSWSPTGRHLLVVSRHRRPDGGYRSRLRVLDVAAGEPRELASLPSEVVPGSYSWSTDGEHLAFIARTDQMTSLCLVGTTDGTFHYLADLGRDSSSPPPFPPVAWSPDGQRLLYAAPPEHRPSAGSRLLRTDSAPALFIADVGQPLGQPLGGATGDAPGWRSDGGIVALTRAKRDSPLVLRAVEPAGDGRDLAELSLSPPAAFVASWDTAHAQMIVALRGAAGIGVNPPEYWLVRFRPEVGR